MDVEGLVILMGSSPGSSEDCGQCRAFPTLCPQIGYCLNKCNVSPQQAINCTEFFRQLRERCQNHDQAACDMKF
jgi:hypothetical protein